MAITAHVYAKFAEAVANKEVNLGSDTLKVMLLTNVTAPVQGTDKYKSVYSTEISGTGYTAGGATLTSVSVSTTGNVYTLTAANPSWTTATFTAAYAVYYDSSPATDATRPLIAYVDFGGNTTVTASTFTITINASGIATWTAS